MKLNEAPETERNVLAAILREPGLYDVATSRGVGEKSFLSDKNREIWKTCCRIKKEGNKIDMVSVAMLVPSLMDYAAELGSSIATTVNFDQWVNDLRRYEAARVLQEGLAEAEAKAGTRDPDLKEITSLLVSLESEAVKISKCRRTPSTRELAANLLCRMKDGMQNEIHLFPPGTEGRSKVHIHRGEFTTIGGRSGTGKTAFVCGAVNVMLSEGLRVLYFCTESDAEDILARIVAAKSSIPHWIFQKRDALQSDIDRFVTAATEMGSSEMDDKLHIVGVDSGVITPSLIRSKIREIENTKGKIDVVIVDFIQGVHPGKTSMRMTKLEQCEYCITDIHNALIQHQIAGIMLSQLNRTGINSGELPRMEHLKDCALLDNLSHTVAFLFRKKQEEGSEEENETRFYSDKTRNQRSFCFKLRWSGTAYTSEMLMDERYATPVSESDEYQTAGDQWYYE